MTAVDALVRSATVRLGPPHDADALWGSGFFVAPGWVLTCLHVLSDRLRPDGTGRVLVQNARVRADACLAYRLSGAGDYGQDLALLRLLDADDAGHPCVWLTDRGDKPARVAAFGWRRPGEDARPLEWSGYCEVNGTDGPYGRTLGPETAVPQGASGGPVVDRDHGSVVGVVKARRRGRDGGLAIATTALRGFGTAQPVAGEKALGDDPYWELMRLHDQWHARCAPAKSWKQVQEQHGGWRPQDRVDALRLLSGLPKPRNPVDVEELVETVLGEEQLWSGTELCTWRDGHGRLYENRSAFEPGSEMIFLHYLLLVSSACAREAPDASARLRSWALGRAESLAPPFRKLLTSVRPAKRRTAAPSRQERRRGEGPYADTHVGANAHTGTGTRADTDADCPVVAVELEPTHYPHGARFYWRVWVWPGGPDTVRSWAEGETGEGTTTEELSYRLSGPLNEAFGQMDTARRRARLEIALPVEHFDIDVDLWRSRQIARRLRPHPSERLLGVHRQVVLRDLHRRGRPAPAWEARWHRVMENGALDGLRLRAYGTGEQALGSAPPGAVPVLCRPAAESADSLREAIGAGHGLALWSRTVSHAYGCGEACEELHERTADLLRGVESADALPEELRMLREQIYDDGPETHWAESLALLYDDPHRPIPEPAGPVDSPS